VGFVGDYGAPEVSGEVSFECTGGMSWGLPLGDLLVVVGAAGAPELGHFGRFPRAVARWAGIMLRLSALARH
jgi:hypothetical protein